MLSERKSKCFTLTQWQCVCISKVSQENQHAIPATKLEMSPIRIVGWKNLMILIRDHSCLILWLRQVKWLLRTGCLWCHCFLMSNFGQINKILQHLQTEKNEGGYFDILHRSTATDICIATGLPDPPYWYACVALNLWSPTTVWLHTTLTRHVPRHSNLALWQAERLPFIHPKQPLFIPPTLLSALWKGPEWPPEPLEGSSVCKWPRCSIAFCCDYDGEGRDYVVEHWWRCHQHLTISATHRRRLKCPFFPVLVDSE